jgi:hypothetical protein
MRIIFLPPGINGMTNDIQQDLAETKPSQPWIVTALD